MSAFFDDLPGWEIVGVGLHDAAEGVESVESLLVEIAGPRLRAHGLLAAPFPTATLDAEIRLYRLLARTHGDDAHGRYNSLLRRLVSFERALDRRFANTARDPASPFTP